MVATFALGTAVGDLTADTWHLGNLVSGFVFCGPHRPAGAARRWFGLSAVAAFWIAYVLTRPLGASFADWMGTLRSAAAWGSRWRWSPPCGRWRSAGFVAYLAVTRHDRATRREILDGRGRGPSAPDGRDRARGDRLRSVGAGHDGAARELARRFRARGCRSTASTSSTCSRPARPAAVRLYRRQLTVAPRSWDWLLAAMDTVALTAAARRSPGSRRPAWLEVLGPDVALAVSTYPLATHALALLKARGELTAPLVV